MRRRLVHWLMWSPLMWKKVGEGPTYPLSKADEGWVINPNPYTMVWRRERRLRRFLRERKDAA